MLRKFKSWITGHWVLTHMIGQEPYRVIFRFVFKMNADRYALQLNDNIGDETTKFVVTWVPGE